MSDLKDVLVYNSSMESIARQLLLALEKIDNKTKISEEECDCNIINMINDLYPFLKKQNYLINEETHYQRLFIETVEKSEKFKFIGEK